MMYCVDNSCTSPEHTAPVCVPQCNDVGWTAVGSATTVRQTAQNKQFQQQHTGYLHIYTALTLDIYTSTLHSQKHGLSAVQPATTRDLNLIFCNLDINCSVELTF